MGFELGPRRGVYIDISKEKVEKQASGEDTTHFEELDLMYRSLCAMLYNYVPMSGHPGGSISSGRFVAGVVFDSLDYDVANPDREEADIVSYAAGHKTLGLYAMWALRNEVIRIGCPELLPRNEKHQLRLEDLLGFRRNPLTRTPLFLKFGVKPLDGHPTPATPFLRLSTGASGVGVAASLGLAFGAMDYYGARRAARAHRRGGGRDDARPGRRGHGRGRHGLPARTRSCTWTGTRRRSTPTGSAATVMLPANTCNGTRSEFALLHDWNAILVPEGMDFGQVLAAQRRALAIRNDQPTAIVYRTQKGWQYGVEGRASHGAGHGLCADGFFKAVAPFIAQTPVQLPRCESANQRCRAGGNPGILEECFWEALTVIRGALERNRPLVAALAQKLREARRRLDRRARTPRPQAPAVRGRLRAGSENRGPHPGRADAETRPGGHAEGRAGACAAALQPGEQGRRADGVRRPLRLDERQHHRAGVPGGLVQRRHEPGVADDRQPAGSARTPCAASWRVFRPTGATSESGSSYGAFIAALGHVAARLHAIGNQARQAVVQEPYKPFILICAHAGVKTGEDGPTHADPQALQLLQGNFPLGTMITLTPWDPQEIWTLVSAALAKRPAVMAPFVTRPSEKVIDRQALGLAPATAAAAGVYLLRRAQGRRDGTLVLQGSDVGYAFVEQALPLLKEKGIDLDVYYVASAELFDLLPAAEKEKAYPEAAAQEAMGITGFTLPTMERWVCSGRGRRLTLHPFREGHFLGSGPAEKVLEEAGLDGESQFRAILRYVEKP